MPKVFLITGTRKGIGRALAEHYLERGAVVAGCSRGEAGIEAARYRHYPVDVSDEKAVVGMVKDIRKEFGRVDVLINNAGIAAMNHFLLTPLQTVRGVFETNLLGSFVMMREAAKVMMKHGGGRIVNFTTVAAALRLEGEAAYASSKAALENLTQTAARELGMYGITVNALGPTPVETDLIKAVPKQKIEALLQRQAIKRFGTVRDIINVVDFFIDDRSDFITGQIVYLGGIHG